MYKEDKMYKTTVLQFSSVTQSCLTLCDPMDCSTPGFPVGQQLPELTQTHVHWVSDTIQLSHLLPSPSAPAFNLSQHQCLFQWVSYLPSGGIKWFLNFLTDEQISHLKNMFLHRKRKGICFDQFIVKHKSLPQYKHNTIEEDFC